MKRISKLNLSTNYDITVNIKDSLECLLESLEKSVEYEKEENASGTTIITLDPENNYCTHYLYYDKAGKFLGFFTNCADGTGEYDNGLEIVFEDKSTLKGTIGEMINEFSEKFITIETIPGLFGGDIGVHYSDWLKAEDNNEYVLVFSEMRDEEEIIAIVRKDKLIEFGIEIDGVDIADMIMKGQGEYYG